MSGSRFLFLYVMRGSEAMTETLHDAGAERNRSAVSMRYLAVAAPCDREFDDITRLTAQLIDVPVAFISLACTGRSRVKASYGWERFELSPEEEFPFGFDSSRPVTIITDMLKDVETGRHPLVAGQPHFRFCASCPLRAPDSGIAGCLTALDYRPHELAPWRVEALDALGRQIIALLELRLLQQRISEGKQGNTSIYPAPAGDVKWSHGGRRRGQMIGDSPAMRSLLETISQVAKGDWTVIIEGETGVGKELVARSIHNASARCNGRFVAVNCAGLTDSILGSQLFGHSRGAFTGAVSDQVGFFEAAEGGTVFLDEIGDVAMNVQSALLRVLQEKEITRIGETQPRKVNARVIVATHRNLRELVAGGQFREDLYYRIRSARVAVPPLRERQQDIPLLVAAFLAEERVNAGKVIGGVSPDVLRLLTQLSWPGNVRELKGVVEHAVICCRTGTIEREDLPNEYQDSCQSVMNDNCRAPEQSGNSERERVLLALSRAGGNKVKAAKLLGIGRATLYRRLVDLSIDGDDGLVT